MKRFTMTEAEALEAREDREGRCLSCGAEAYDLDPDTHDAECDECGEPMVYAIEEMALAGVLTVIPGRAERTIYITPQVGGAE